ncbi:MAG: hypothetical protein GC178_08890 [Flavobacteriales bacterium]|nr:hypothetical protein [Flavobacteriales bacterium]
MDSNLIKNRPKELEQLNYYTELPQKSVFFNYSSLPAFLNYDLYQLFGIMPKTLDLIQNTQPSFQIKPSEKEVEYYQGRSTRFQAINVVANIHTFKDEGDNVIAYPYSISLVPGQKRAQPDTCSIEFLATVGLDKVKLMDYCFTDLSPFLPVHEGFYAPLGMFFGKNGVKSYTDTIGFILETFCLPTNVDLTDALISSPESVNEEILEKYQKYRIKRYFKPFVDLKPRRIWGCDSPIELFLIQGLAQIQMFPTIQTLIFKGGKVYDNFFEMIATNTFIPGDQLITEVDLYFPNEKLSVFCDSTKHHRSTVSRKKDLRIAAELESLGIKTLRLSGSEIVKNLSQTVEKVRLALNSK